MSDVLDEILDGVMAEGFDVGEGSPGAADDAQTIRGLVRSKALAVAPRARTRQRPPRVAFGEVKTKTGAAAGVAALANFEKWGWKAGQGGPQVRAHAGRQSLAVVQPDGSVVYSVIDPRTRTLVWEGKLPLRIPARYATGGGAAAAWRERAIRAALTKLTGQTWKEHDVNAPGPDLEPEGGDDEFPAERAVYDLWAQESAESGVGERDARLLRAEGRRLERGTSRMRAWRRRLIEFDGMGGGDSFSADGFGVIDLLTDITSTAKALYDSWRAGTARYGCYCGPGTCDATFRRAPHDGLDACCHRHDLDYGAVRVNTAGGVSMWTPVGFRRSRVADQRLVSCSRALASTWNPKDPIRSLVERMFAQRVEMAKLLDGPGIPSCVRNNGKVPLWDFVGLTQSCLP